jgi:hypothetical protein
VAWSFLGIRKKSGLQEDMEQGQPVSRHRGHWRGHHFCAGADRPGELGGGALSGRTHPRDTDKQSREQEKK